ncbi:MAG: hypothetical protein ACRD4S_07575 [Candidatus Acidiferrales bacterium]
MERFDGKPLVSYRDTQIREIDPQRETERPLVVERGGAEDAPVAVGPSYASSADKTSCTADPKV